MKNCIIRTVKDDRNVFWKGYGWTEDRDASKLYSLPEVEQVVDNMRDDQEFAYWERFNPLRTSL
jgi:hypothetical protein